MIAYLKPWKGAERRLRVPSSNLYSNCKLFSKERAAKCVKPGGAIVLDTVPHRVISIIQGKRGKGGGFVRARLRNLVSSNVFEKTFTSDEIVEEADLQKEMVQYSWTDGNELVFMNNVTFEEVRALKSIVDNSQFLLEGQEVKLMKFGDDVIGVELPVVCEFEVASIDVTRSILDFLRESPILMEWYGRKFPFFTNPLALPFSTHRAVAELNMEEKVKEQLLARPGFKLYFEEDTWQYKVFLKHWMMDLQSLIHNEKTDETEARDVYTALLVLLIKCPQEISDSIQLEARLHRQSAVVHSEQLWRKFESTEKRQLETAAAESRASSRISRKIQKMEAINNSYNINKSKEINPTRPLNKLIPMKIENEVNNNSPSSSILIGTKTEIATETETEGNTAVVTKVTLSSPNTVLASSSSVIIISPSRRQHRQEQEQRSSSRRRRLSPIQRRIQSASASPSASDSESSLVKNATSTSTKIKRSNNDIDNNEIDSDIEHRKILKSSKTSTSTSRSTPGIRLRMLSLPSLEDTKTTNDDLISQSISEKKKNINNINNGSSHNNNNNNDTSTTMSNVKDKKVSNESMGGRRKHRNRKSITNAMSSSDTGTDTNANTTSTSASTHAVASEVKIINSRDESPAIETPTEYENSTHNNNDSSSNINNNNNSNSDVKAKKSNKSTVGSSIKLSVIPTREALAPELQKSRKVSRTKKNPKGMKMTRKSTNNTLTSSSSSNNSNTKKKIPVIPVSDDVFNETLVLQVLQGGGESSNID
eukprot:gene10122-21091_t